MAAYNEEEFVITKFKKRFSLYRNKRIVLYGTGKNTEAILRKCEQDFCIVGVMDVSREGELFCGREILSIKQVKDLRADLIVMVCLPVSEDIVFERIRAYTEREQIEVFNLDGILMRSCRNEYRHERLTDVEKKKLAETEGTLALFKCTAYGDLEHKADTWIKKNMLDLFMKELLKNPFDVREDGRVFVADSEKMGYLYWGPIFTGFLLWMVKAAMNDQCDIILFQSRDGYLLQKMYLIMKHAYKEVQFPADVYFLASRRSSMVPGIRTEEDIRIAARYSWYGTNENFMARRFGVETDGKELSEINREEYALKYKERIFERAEEERLHYKVYLDGLFIRQYRKAALIDTTAAGTVQTNLQHFVELPMKGYYFLKRVSEIEENNRIEFSSYYPVKPPYEIRENVFAYFRFMELVLSSREATLICFDQNGKPIYAEEKRGEEEKNVLQCIQKGVLRYFEDICGLHLNWDILELDRDFADEILGTMSRRNMVLGDDRIRSWVLEDYFSNVEKKACERL